MGGHGWGKGQLGMIRRLYDWTMGLAGHRRAWPALAAVSFVESSVFPIPPDVLMIPMVLADRARAFRIALVTTLASVLGGLAGYGIGFFLFDTLGEPILALYGKTETAARFAQSFNDWGVWAVLIAGVTPFPFKVVTITAGWTGLSLPVFIVSALVARSLRFFLVAALLWRFGPAIRDFIERRLGLVFTLLMAGLLGGFLIVRYL